MTNLCLYSNFDPASLQFGPVARNGKGSLSVPVYTSSPDGSQKRVVIQTPAMLAPYGLSNFTQGTDSNWSLDVSFRNADADPKVADFLARMRKLDDTVLATAKTRCKEWNLKKDYVDAFYKPRVEKKENKKTGEVYPPQMRTKVQSNRDSGQLNVSVYDENRKPVEPDYITKGATVKVIMELGNVWFMGGNSFGVSWRVVQVCVVARPGFNAGFGFLPDGEEATEAALDDTALAMLDG